MGNEKNEEVVDQLEDMLGLGETKEDGASLDDAKDTIQKDDDKKTDGDKQLDTQKSEDEKTEDKKEDKKQTTETKLVTPEQITIQKDIAKIDVKIEELEKATVDMDAFFTNIENELSEEEQQLEFDDKAAYMKLVNEKAKEYEQKNSKSEVVEELKKEKEELEAVYERQNAIVSVSSKYPDYDHEKMMEYFNEDLSKSQQNKILSSSTSYEDVYENTYKQYLSANPAKIEDVKTPNIPNVNNVRKEQTKSNDTDADLMGEDEKLKEALGL
jgi:hypothetical protein